MTWWGKALLTIAVIAVLIWVAANPHHAGVTVHHWVTDTIAFAKGLGKG